MKFKDFKLKNMSINQNLLIYGNRITCFPILYLFFYWDNGVILKLCFGVIRAKRLGNIELDYQRTFLCKHCNTENYVYGTKN